MAPFPSKKPVLPIHRFPPTTQSTNEPIKGQVPRPAPGQLGGLGQTWNSREAVQQALQDYFTRQNTESAGAAFKAEHSPSQQILAAYSLGGGPLLIQDIYAQYSPLQTCHPTIITPRNWLEYLQDEAYLPNYITFFTTQILQVPPQGDPQYGKPNSLQHVLEHYLFGGAGDMLLRAFDNNLAALTLIGNGIEFRIPHVVAEGLAYCAIQKPVGFQVFDGPWPPPPQEYSPLQSSITSAFSSFKSSLSSSTSLLSSLGLAPTSVSSNNTPGAESFAITVARLSRQLRIPKEGLSGFTILERISTDTVLDPSVLNLQNIQDPVDYVSQVFSPRLRRWCSEWRFIGQGSLDYGQEEEYDAPLKKVKKMVVPSWAEIVDKTEELMWMATVLYASTAINPSAPLYALAQLLASTIALPPILETVSAQSRPYLLQGVFRILVTTWLTYGKRECLIHNVLQNNLDQEDLPVIAPNNAATPPIVSGINSGAPNQSMSQQVKNELLWMDRESYLSTGEKDAPSPTASPASGTRLYGELEGERDRDSPWPALVLCAADHPDQYLAKVIRSLAFAATHFGGSKKGIYPSSLRGTAEMDGTIFARAASLTLRTMGWGRDKGIVGNWDYNIQTPSPQPGAFEDTTTKRFDSFTSSIPSTVSSPKGKFRLGSVDVDSQMVYQQFGVNVGCMEGESPVAGPSHRASGSTTPTIENNDYAIVTVPMEPATTTAASRQSYYGQYGKMMDLRNREQAQEAREERERLAREQAEEDERELMA